MDLVSIIIPYYKKRRYITDTLKSVLKQTYKNFEIIIIYDDDDKDELKFLKKLVKIDKRIILMINKKSLGAGLSRNKGIKKSKGRYVSFIDADDLWKKNKLELQIKFMKEKNFLISHTDYEIIDNQNNILNYRTARNFNSISDLLKSCDIGLSSVIVKKEILTKGCCKFEDERRLCVMAKNIKKKY